MLQLFEKKEKLQTRHNEIIKQLREILKEITLMINNDPKFKYVYNEVGSGEVCYKTDQTEISYNEFPRTFNGFYINNKKVSFSTFIKFINKDLTNTKEQCPE